MAVAKPKLALGQKMRDRVTGFTGIAVVMTDFMTGNRQYTLAPSQDDKLNKDKGELAFDAHQLEYVSKVLDPIPAPKDTGIVLGRKVKDLVTDFAGIATLRSEFLNGCVYYTVVAKIDKENRHTEGFYEYKRLESVGEGVLPKIEQRIAAEKPATVTGSRLRPPGGPAHRVAARG